MVKFNDREKRESPSSRRAWIEINLPYPSGRGSPVALLAEGVDRNLMGQRGAESARVALLAEGVDRNQSVGDSFRQNGGRPPRGGRG